MRISTGKFKNKRLLTPSLKEGKVLRPTSGRVREAIFNMLCNIPYIDFNQSIDVLDLCCGSGALGFEALSRGARSVTFVDVNRNHIELARENAKLLKVLHEVDFINADINNLRLNQKYDLIFLDPPYGNPKLIKDILVKLDTWANRECIIVIEYGIRDKFELSQNLETLSIKEYGITKVLICIYR